MTVRVEDKMAVRYNDSLTTLVGQQFSKDVKRYAEWLATLASIAMIYGMNLRLQQLGLTVSLGGTSNHFCTAALHILGGWGMYNVTEGHDLGIMSLWIKEKKRGRILSKHPTPLHLVTPQEGEAREWPFPCQDVEVAYRGKLAPHLLPTLPSAEGGT